MATYLETPSALPNGLLTTADEVNKRLLQRYLEIINRDELIQMAAGETKGRLSGLFLPKVSQAYLDSPAKVLLVGKETRKWCESLEDLAAYSSLSDYLTANMNRHAHTATGNVGNIKFLQFYQSLYKKLNIGQSIDTVLWANLFCVSLNSGSPLAADGRDYIDRLSLELLKAQLDILKPDVVLFVSGPSYDNQIKKIFESYETTPDSIKRKLWKFKTPNLIAYRTSHPVYLSDHSFRSQAIESIRKDLETITSTRRNSQPESLTAGIHKS